MKEWKDEYFTEMQFLRFIYAIGIITGVTNGVGKIIKDETNWWFVIITGIFLFIGSKGWKECCSLYLRAIRECSWTKI